MQYIKLKYQTDEVDLFSDDDMDGDIQPIPREDYERLIEFLQDYNPPAILPIQIAYYAGLRIGEACGLAWQDVNLEEQCLTIRRSIRYDGSRHKNIIGPTKRKKVRIVDFGDTLTEIRITNEAAPKDIQELLGHSDVSTTMNVYAHSTRKAKRESARLLDKVAGND